MLRFRKRRRFVRKMSRRLSNGLVVRRVLLLLSRVRNLRVRRHLLFRLVLIKLLWKVRKILVGLPLGSRIVLDRRIFISRSRRVRLRMKSRKRFLMIVLVNFLSRLISDRSRRILVRVRRKFRLVVQAIRKRRRLMRKFVVRRVKRSRELLQNKLRSLSSTKLTLRLNLVSLILQSPSLSR